MLYYPPFLQPFSLSTCYSVISVLRIYQSDHVSRIAASEAEMKSEIAKVTHEVCSDLCIGKCPISHRAPCHDMDDMGKRLFQQCDL